MKHGDIVRGLSDQYYYIVVTLVKNQYGIKYRVYQLSPHKLHHDTIDVKNTDVKLVAAKGTGIHRDLVDYIKVDRIKCGMGPLPDFVNKVLEPDGDSNVEFDKFTPFKIRHNGGEWMDIKDLKNEPVDNTKKKVKKMSREEIQEVFDRTTGEERVEKYSKQLDEKLKELHNALNEDDKERVKSIKRSLNRIRKELVKEEYFSN